MDGRMSKAFQDLKAYLTTALLLSPSIPGEELYLYLAVSPHAVSSALIRKEGKVQKPVYYTSRALRGAEVISANGKIGFCINNGFQEVKTLLPISCNCCYN